MAKVAVLSVVVAVSVCIGLLDDAGHVFAYQLRVIESVPQGTTITISTPRHKQFWFDELGGLPRVYEVVSHQSFRLTLSLRIPDKTPQSPPLAFSVRELSQGVATPDRVIQPQKREWNRIYEWVDGRYYLERFVVDEHVPPGTYRITVASEQAPLPYVLAVGHMYDIRQFNEIVRSLRELPVVATFLGETPLLALKSPLLLSVALCFFMMLLVVIRVYRYYIAPPSLIKVPRRNV